MPPPFPGRVSGFDRAGDDWILQEYHFVDDARYAANYLQVHGKRKSQAELKLYLQRKGISREIIREQLEETEHDSGEAIRVLLEKKHYRAGETAPEEEKRSLPI